MRATDREFRLRAYMSFVLIGAGFACYFVDPQNLADAVVNALVHGIGAQQTVALRWILAAGGLFIALGAAVRTWAAAYLRSEVVHDPAVHSEALVADGPFRHLRNPLYLGMILMAVGLAPLASRLGAAVIVLGMILFTLRLAGREEASLLAAQGEGYRRYREAVPSFVPALRPRLPSGGATPAWGQAFLGEAPIWIFSAALFAYAATLSPRVLEIGIGVGILGIVAARGISKRVFGT